MRPCLTTPNQKKAIHKYNVNNGQLMYVHPVSQATVQLQMYVQVKANLVITKHQWC